LAQSLVGIGAVFSAGAIVGGLKSMVTEAGKFQQIETSFRVMIGSAGDYKEVLNVLNQLSIKTPFTPEQVFKSGKALLAFNIEAKDLNKTVTMLGDIAAGTGKDLTELSVIYGQIKSSGRLMGQDLLQLINAGFNPLAEISKETGRSMKDLKKGYGRWKHIF
jgi:phage tail tape-measure protein